MKRLLEWNSPAQTTTSRRSTSAEMPPPPGLKRQANFHGDAARQQTSDLLDCALQGDIEAFLALMRPLERTLYLAAFAYAGNHADAEQIAQEAMFLALKSLASFDRRNELKIWLIKLAFRVARACFSRQDQDSSNQAMEYDETLQSQYLPKADWNSLHMAMTSRAETHKHLTSVVQCAPRPYREVLFLRDVLHLTTTHTAEALGLSEEIVRRRLSVARFELCDAWASKMIDSDTFGKLPSTYVSANSPLLIL